MLMILVTQDKVQYSMWEMMFRIDSLPASERNKYANLILYGVVAGDYLEVDGTKTRKSCSSLQPYLHAMVDEMLQLAEEGDEGGIQCVDASLPEGDSDRLFQLRTKLLLVIADYPGHCKIGCQCERGYNGCCRCHISGTYVERRVVFQGHGDMVQGDQPRPWTSEELDALGLMYESHNANPHIGKTRLKAWCSQHGVNGHGALHRISDFDHIRDEPLDAMHCVKCICRHLFRCFKAKQPEKKSSAKRKSVRVKRTCVKRGKVGDSAEADEGDDELTDDSGEDAGEDQTGSMEEGGDVADDDAAGNGELTDGGDDAAFGDAHSSSNEETDEQSDQSEHREINKPEFIQTRAKMWRLPEKCRDACDAAFKAMPVAAGLINKTLRPFKHTGRIKMHDWLKFVESWGLYVLASSALGEEEMKFLEALFKVLRLVLRRKNDVVDKELPAKMLAVLAEMECILPATEHAIVFHACVHISEAIIEWSSAQSFWMFGFESYIGFLSRLIKSRKAPEESLVRMYAIMIQRWDCIPVDGGNARQLYEMMAQSERGLKLLVRLQSQLCHNPTSRELVASFEAQSANHRLVEISISPGAMRYDSTFDLPRRRNNSQTSGLQLSSSAELRTLASACRESFPDFQAQYPAGQPLASTVTRIHGSMNINGFRRQSQLVEPVLGKGSYSQRSCFFPAARTRAYTPLHYETCAGRIVSCVIVRPDPSEGLGWVLVECRLFRAHGDTFREYVVVHHDDFVDVYLPLWCVGDLISISPHPDGNLREICSLIIPVYNK
jgi:hypothetical protein